MKENMHKYYALHNIVWDRQGLARNYIDKENYIVWKTGEKIGFVSLERRPTELFVHTVQICPALQNRRIGFYILRALIGIMSEAGIRTLGCNVFKDSAALAVYERLGFEKIACAQTLNSPVIRMKRNFSECDIAHGSAAVRPRSP